MVAPDLENRQTPANYSYPTWGAVLLERVKLEDQGQGGNRLEEALEEEDITREGNLEEEAFSLPPSLL